MKVNFYFVLGGYISFMRCYLHKDPGSEGGCYTNIKGKGRASKYIDFV